jgi:hypothetical protein
MKYFSILLFVLVFLLSSCRKEATTWYSDWTIPLVSDTLTLKNLTNDSTLAIQNGFYFLDFSRKIASIQPSEYVKIPDTIIRQKFAISFSSLTVPPGTSFVNDNKDHIFDLGDVQLKLARVKKGTISLEVFNPVATKTFFDIELPGAKKNNQVLKKTLTVEAGTIQNPNSNKFEIDLSGYLIDLTGSNYTSFNALASKLTVKTDPSGNSVQLSSADSTQLFISLAGIEFDYAKGYFGNYKVTDSFSFESEFLKNQVQGTIDLPNLDLQLSFENSIKVSAKANLKKLNNINSKVGTNVLLAHPIIGNPFTIQTASGAWSNVVSSNKEINFTPQNSNLEQFIENLGETTQIEYELELNPWGNISAGHDEFFPTSALDVDLSLQMPLNIGLNNLSVLDTFPVSFQQDYEKTQIQAAILHLKTENAFPLEGIIEISFLDVNNQEIYKINSSEKIPSSVFGEMTSFGILASKKDLDIALNEALFDQLNEVKKLAVKVKLNTPNLLTNFSEQVLISEKAFLKIKIQASFNLENRIGK